MKTLAVYHKQLGDTLLLQPALAKLAREDDGPVGLVTRPGFADLVGLMPGVQAFTWKNAPRAERLLAYDAGDRTSFSSLACRAGTKTLLTFSSFYRRFFHPWIFHRIQYQEQEKNYRARHFWNITPGDDAGFEPPRLNAPPSEWRHPQMPREPFILIHPTSAWQQKCWPAQPWREVIASLRGKTSMPIVLTGGLTDWERGLCAEIAEADSAVLNLGGRTSLRQFISIVSHAGLVLCVDGFISHLAMAYRRPCVTVFGPTNASHWHLTTPWSAVVQGRPAQGKPRMGDVSAADMMAPLDQMLAQQHQRGAD